MQWQSLCDLFSCGKNTNTSAQIDKGGWGMLLLQGLKISLNYHNHRPVESAQSPKPQSRELVSANVATLLDQTVGRLVGGNSAG